MKILMAFKEETENPNNDFVYNFQPKTFHFGLHFIIFLYLWFCKTLPIFATLKPKQHYWGHEYFCKYFSEGQTVEFLNNEKKMVQPDINPQNPFFSFSWMKTRPVTQNPPQFPFSSMNIQLPQSTCSLGLWAFLVWIGRLSKWAEIGATSNAWFVTLVFCVHVLGYRFFFCPALVLTNVTMQPYFVFIHFVNFNRYWFIYHLDYFMLSISLSLLDEFFSQEFVFTFLTIYTSCSAS